MARVERFNVLFWFVSYKQSFKFDFPNLPEITSFLTLVTHLAFTMNLGGLHTLNMTT